MYNVSYVTITNEIKNRMKYGDNDPSHGTFSIVFW